MGCGEDMVVAAHMKPEEGVYKIEAGENAEFAAEEVGAPIMNVDANFVVPEAERHQDFAFPRLTQLHERGEIAEKHGSLISLADIPRGMRDQRPYRRPDFLGEWRLLRKAWSLYRRGREDLSLDRVKAATHIFYQSDPLRSLQDWLWRFSLFLEQPDYEPLFLAAIEVIKPLMQQPGIDNFVKHYNVITSERSDRYFELMNAYFDAYNDFAQVFFHVVRGLPIPDGNVASSIDFAATRMFYGNAFEVFSSSVDILAYANNMAAGRPFDIFERLTQKQYLRLDKANRFDAFAGIPAFVALCGERDNQLRNASHHGSLRFDRNTQTIRFRAGKGSGGPEQKMGYGTYLARCTKIFLQAITLLRIEIMMCHSTGAKPPLA
jgi:hypothetical protein